MTFAHHIRPPLEWLILAIILQSICVQAAEIQESSPIKRIQLPTRTPSSLAPPVNTINSSLVGVTNYDSPDFLPARSPIVETASLANRMESITNIAQGIERYMEERKRRYEEKLAETNLHANVRRTYEQLFTNSVGNLERIKSNQFLWADLRRAQESRDAAAMVQAKQKIANYLVAVSKRNPRDFPQGVTYDGVISEYKERLGVRSDRAASRTAIRVGILVALIVPTLIFGFYVYRRMRNLQNPNRKY